MEETRKTHCDYCHFDSFDDSRGNCANCGAGRKPEDKGKVIKFERESTAGSLVRTGTWKENLPYLVGDGEAVIPRGEFITFDRALTSEEVERIKDDWKIFYTGRVDEPHKAHGWVTLGELVDSVWYKLSFFFWPMKD